MGRSKGTDTDPTLSGGMGRSGVQREYGSPAKEDDAAAINNIERAITKTALKGLMSIPQPKTMTHMYRDEWKIIGILPPSAFECQELLGDEQAVDVCEGVGERFRSESWQKQTRGALKMEM
jgi:hypothetical protein